MKFTTLICAAATLVPVVARADEPKSTNAYVLFDTVCWENGRGQDKGCTRELVVCGKFADGFEPADGSDLIAVPECPKRPFVHSCTGRLEYADMFYYKLRGDQEYGDEHEQCLRSGGTWK